MKTITQQRNQPHWSGWYDQMIDHIDYYLKVGKKNYFIGGVAVRTDGKEPIKDKDNSYLVYDYPDRIKEINNFIKQLIKNKLKYFCLYCGRGFLGTPDKYTDVFEFIEWVRKEGYKFNEFFGIEYSPSMSCWEFHGNLDKYSSAFNFRVFDKDTIEKIKILTKDLQENPIEVAQ